MDYAIDKPRHQQLFVRYKTKEEKRYLIEVLEKMEFKLADYITKDTYDFPIITINYLDKVAFGSNVTCMSCASQLGVVILATEKFEKEFYPYRV